MTKKTTLLREMALNKTLEERPNADHIGENTEKLSEISANDDDLLLNRRHGHTGWTEKIRLLLRKKDVRVFSIINILLLLVNFMMFAIFVKLAVPTIMEKLSVNKEENRNRPCLYEWTDWSNCSAKCRLPNSPPPMMYRKVKPETIFYARGIYEKRVPCPEKIEELVDRAPCNVFYCPKNLSEFTHNIEFTGRDSTKQFMRNVSQDFALIRIDTRDLYKLKDE